MLTEKISSRQFMWLTITACIASSTIVVPAMVIFYAKQNSWLALILATGAILAGLMLNLSLVREFPGQTVAQYAQILLGTWLGKLVGLFYALAFLYLVGICLNFVTRMFTIAVMPETPLWPFVTGLTLLSVYSAWLGLEPIARANDLVLPVTVLFLLIILMLALPQGKIYQALPTTQINLAEILRGSYPMAACLSEVFFILTLAPALNKPEELKSATVKGILLAGLFLTVITQTLVAVLGVFRASAYLFPLMRLSEELIILDIFEKFEPLVLSGWIIINSVKMGLFTYLFALTAAHTFNKKTYKPFLLFALIVLPFLALTPKSIAETMQFWSNLVSFQYLLPTAFLFLPGILLIIAKVKHRHV
ncbi:MAG: GerAB/ArcD/ProY family transporter [Desulfitobacteriaceae bacterium]